MKRRMIKSARTLWLFATALLFVMSPLRLPAVGAEETGGTEELAKKTQNPVSDLISVPFQNNINFGVGPDDKVQNVLNIQPVVPFRLSEEWNLITRTIAPIISQPELISGDGRTTGLGDINMTGFLSPGKPGPVIWGVGPSVSFPTATDRVLGTEKWSIGPSVVLLTMPGHWVIGALTNNLWSFAGDDDRADVNQFLLQYFVNYNLPRGWYLTSSPIITANWEADSNDRWIVPIGGGVGRILRIGRQPVNLQTQGFYNVETPGNGPDWTLRVQVQFLFPK